MSWWDFRGEDEESEDKDEEEKKLDALGSDIDSEEEENTYYLGLIEKLKESKFYQTSGFTNGIVPAEMELYRGKINVLGNTQQIVGENCSTMDYDSMEAYQKALPGQGFIEIMQEVKGADGQPKLSCFLMPVFNAGEEKLEERRKHLETLGIPYLISERPRGGTTGVLHIRARLRLPRENKDMSVKLPPNSFGLGIKKGEQLLGRSQSQNAHSVQYDEEFLLAHGLEYKIDSNEDTEFTYRRLLPPDILLKHNNFLMKEMSRFAEEKKHDRTNYPHLDNGQWLSETPQKLLNYQEEYRDMAEWSTLPRSKKNQYLLNTFYNAIKFKDPPSYTDSVSLNKQTSFITRILRLNESRQLGLDFNGDHNGYSLLMHAVMEDLPKAVNQLCDAQSIEGIPRVNVNQQSCIDKDTAMHIACRNGKVQIVEKLLESKANLNMRNVKKQNPIDTTLARLLAKNQKNELDQKNHVEILMRLIKAGGKPNKPLEYYSQVQRLLNLIKKFNSGELTDCILKCFGKHHGDFLFSAVEENNFEALRQLLECKVEEKTSDLAQLSIVGQGTESKTNLVNIYDSEKNSLLHYAIQQGNEKMVEYLLDKKADCNSKNKIGIDLLDYAIHFEHPAILKILLEHGATPDKSKLERINQKSRSPNIKEIESLYQEALQKYLQP